MTIRQVETQTHNMSFFTNHPHGSSDIHHNEFLPDAATSVSDHSTIYSGSGISNLTENSHSRSSSSGGNGRHNTNNRSSCNNDDSSLRRDREREGRCADCGAETHEMRYDPETGVSRKVPLNIEGEVHRGRCLLCNPLPARLLAMQHHHRGLRHPQEQLSEAEEFESVQSSGRGATQQYWRESSPSSSFHSTGTGHRQSSFHSTGTSQSLDGREGRRRNHHSSQRRTRACDASVGSSQSYNSAPAQSYNTVSTTTQSYNSAPQSYTSAPTTTAYGNNHVSSQRSQHSNSNTYPIGVTRSSDFHQSAAAAARAAPPLEEFTIYSNSRGERQSQQHREQDHPSQQTQQRQQRQNFRQQYHENGRTASNNSIGQQQQSFRQQYHENGRTASNNSIATYQDENMAIEEGHEQQSEEYSSPTVARSRTSQQQLQQPQQQQQQQSPANNEQAAIHQILSSMQRYPNHVPTQSKGLHSLWVLSWDDTNSATIGRLGGIPLILDSMRLHPNTPTLQSNGIATLQNLAMTPQNRNIITTESDGVSVIVDVMAQFIEDKALQQSGCTALANLANGTPEEKTCVAEGGGILAMMRAVDAHRGDESIMRAAYQALRKLGYTPGS